MNKILIALVLAVVMSGDGFSKTGYDHGQSITFCYNENLFSTMSETDEYFLSEYPKPCAINLRGRFFVTFGSNCLRLPAAAFLGLENFSLSASLEFKTKKSFLSK